jgi:hypothetical protein
MSPKSATDPHEQPQQKPTTFERTVEVKKPTMTTPTNLGYLQALNSFENLWNLSTEDDVKPVTRKRLPAFERITTILPTNPQISTCDSEEEEDDFDFIAKFTAIAK